MLAKLKATNLIFGGFQLNPKKNAFAFSFWYRCTKVTEVCWQIAVGYNNKGWEVILKAALHLLVTQLEKTSIQFPKEEDFTRIKNWSLYTNGISFSPIEPKYDNQNG